MADKAHEWTDEEIRKLQRRFDKAYGQAAKEMRHKLNDYLSQYGEANDQWRDMLKSDEVTDEQYKAWLRSQSLRRDYLVDMCDTLARDATRTNQLATDMINDELPRVYAENANYAAYGIESHLRRNTHAFDLVDQSTVRRLMGMPDDGQVIKEVTTDKSIVSPPLVTMRKLNIDEAKDVRWNRQKFNAALTQSILQGESIPNTAKRMAGVLNMGRNMSVRAARTAMTSAENAGRVDSYKRAERIGIALEQEWMATLDERTRHSHRLMDGEHVKVGQKFSNGLEFPGDPSGPGEEIWNCRCTLVAWLPGIEQEDNQRWSRLPEGMTYEDWKSGKVAEEKRKERSGVVDGKDILATWKRREGEFDFEIEDIINAQGFDGKPRIMDADEFDKAVKAANGGDGLIMQRVYSAPDQATLDAYRDQLYSGKWYVDCSVGGAEYGKGMYCAGDWAESLSDKTVTSMRHYASMYDGLSNVETMTLDPTARVIKTSDLTRESAKARSSVMDSIAADVVEENLDMSGMGDLREAERRYLTDLAVGRRPSVSIDPERYGMSVDDMDEFGEYLRGLTNERASFDDRIARLDNMDEGVLAAALGYDAIDVRGQGYVVVLNRTKLIIREPE